MSPPPSTPTRDQLARVRTVVAPYRADALTADDAKALHRALRDVGLCPGPALDAALAAAGFSAQRLEALDPRQAVQPPPRQ